MDENAIETAIRAAYASRAANDAAGAGRIFAPGATYRVVGEQKHCAAVGAFSGADISLALTAIVERFRATAFEIARW
jgi:hypothetical protein